MQKEAPAMVPLLFEIRSPHPPASAGTFSQWEKGRYELNYENFGSSFPAA